MQQPFTILLLGASGQFGTKLAERLAALPHLRLLLCGRQLGVLEAQAHQLGQNNPATLVRALACDIQSPQFAALLNAERPQLVIHLAGPFQGQGYDVARACLAAGISYIDMADGRDFVTGFSSLHAEAKAKNIFMVTGASTVPGLSSALLDHFAPRFKSLHSVSYGISAGLKTGLGPATLKAVLSYCGKAYKVWKSGVYIDCYGLSHPRAHTFSAPVGRRMLVNCDIPDHSLFPARYPSLRNMEFASCLDLPLLAQLLNAMSWVVKHRMLRDWNFLTGLIPPAVNLLKPLGSRTSGFFMELQGLDNQRASYEIIAHQGSGLHIPITPVMLLVKNIMAGNPPPPGAYPCMGLFTLAEFQAELAAYPIEFHGGNE